MGVTPKGSRLLPTLRPSRMAKPPQPPLYHLDELVMVLLVCRVWEH